MIIDQTLNMKHFLIICTCFISLKCVAQNKGHLQINFAINAMKANTLKDGYNITTYSLLDSANSMFKRYDYRLNQIIKSKIKAGISIGVSYEHQISKILKLSAGIGFSNCVVERDIYFQPEMNDSPTVKLLGTGPIWTDPANGFMVQRVSGNTNPSSPWGQIFGYGSGSNVIVLNRERHLFKYSAEGKEKIKIILIDIPVGISINPGKSKFQFQAEICPSFSIHSSALIAYKVTSEVSQPDQPAYIFNRTQWRAGAGIFYTISQSVQTGFMYYQYLNPVLKNDNARLQSVALKFYYSIPFTIHP